MGFIALPGQICLDDKATEWMRDQDESLVVEPQDVQEWAVFAVPALALTLPALPRVPPEIVKRCWVIYHPQPSVTETVCVELACMSANGCDTDLIESPAGCMLLLGLCDVNPSLRLSLLAADLTLLRVCVEVPEPASSASDISGQLAELALQFALSRLPTIPR